MKTIKEIIVKNQKQLENIKRNFDGYIYIEGGTKEDPLVLEINFEKAAVIVRGSAHLDRVGGSARIDRVMDSASIGTVMNSASIGTVMNSARIAIVSGSASIGTVMDSASIARVMNSARIARVWGSARIDRVMDSASIGTVMNSARIDRVMNSASIARVMDSASIELFGEAVVFRAESAQKIVCHGYNTIIVHKSDRTKLGLVMNKDSHLVILPDNTLRTAPTFKEYARRYPVKVDGKYATLYKAVHKTDGQYVSHYSWDFEYKIGETKEHENNLSIEESCTYGLHVSHFDWAYRFGCTWSDLAILECKVAISDIVVSKDCDGKVRTSKLTVIREVPKEEYETIYVQNAKT